MKHFRLLYNGDGFCRIDRMSSKAFEHAGLHFWQLCRVKVHIAILQSVTHGCLESKFGLFMCSFT